jgi:hypothetical protein
MHVISLDAHVVQIPFSNPDLLLLLIVPLKKLGLNEMLFQLDEDIWRSCSLLGFPGNRELVSMTRLGKLCIDHIQVFKKLRLLLMLVYF